MSQKDTFRSPLFVFLAYMAASFAVVFAWNWFFPADKAPLAVYLLTWRFFSAFTGWVNLYPALAFSALVIPFGAKEHSESGYAGSTYIGKKSFSVSFLHYITWPVITAACAAVLYSALLFIALPAVQNRQYLMINRGEFYVSAMEKAKNHVSAGNWAEAMQYLAVCEGIWPKSTEVQNFRDTYLPAFSSYEERVRRSKSGESPESAPGAQPISAAQALARAETAFAEERWYDAHWLATLAERLARPGSAEIAPAQALASRAWNKIAELEPSVREKERFSRYRLKQDGYQAMLAGEWIAAYYIFKELSGLTPKDPDVTHYLADCTRNLSSLAFFMDEVEPALGDLIRNPVFSLPLDKKGGRLVFRCSSLVLLPDYAYAWDPELIAVDSDGVFRYHVYSPYSKIIPLLLGDAGDPGVAKTAILLRALDRTDSERRWDPEWFDDSGAPLAAAPPVDAGSSQILVNLSFNDFLLLADTQQTTDNLTLTQLFAVDERLSDYGYLPEIFQAEILRRLAKPVFFLPMSVLVLLAGWRYRARGKPRAVLVLMFAALPAVFYGIVLFLRGLLNDLAIVLSISFGYSTILAGFIVVSALCFIVSLILLAAQHG